MDLDNAAQTHGEWKLRLRLAITKKEFVDTQVIARDDCCALGKWLHGEARQRYAGLAALGACVTQHAAFHREAGKVASAINAGDYANAEKMLDAGTPYSKVSSAVVAAILTLKKQAALQA